MDRLETLASPPDPEDLIMTGYIAGDATHPDDEVGFLLPSYDLSKVFGPSHFEPRPLQDGSLLLPTRNDPCVVAIDEEGEARLLTWWASDPTDPVNVVTQDEFDAIQPTLHVTGDHKYSIRSADHAGWLLEDGRAITAGLGFPALRALLIAEGNQYGTSGADPRLPDCRGRALIGAGAGTGLTNRLPGAQVGEENHVITIAEMPAHGHPHNMPGPLWWEKGSGGPRGVNTGVFADFQNLTIGNTGGGGSHNNMQPSLAMNGFVKT